MVTYLLVMDGLAQDELLHQTDLGLESQRTNLTFRWIKRHAHGCSLSTVVAFCLPSCAKGLSCQQTLEGNFFVLLVLVELVACFPALLLTGRMLYGGRRAVGHAQFAEVPNPHS